MDGSNSFSPTQLNKVEWWKDLSVDEKIERMRQTIKNLQESNQRLSNEFYEIRKILTNHSHLDGAVLMRAEVNTCGMGSMLSCEKMPNSNPDEVYF